MCQVTQKHQGTCVMLLPPSPTISLFDMEFEPSENSIKSASYYNNPGLTAKGTILAS